MSRFDLFIDTHVWYASLKLEKKAFADERDKKKFLEYLLQSKKEKGLRVFAFSLLDDEVHFLLGTKEEDREAAAQNLWYLLRRYEEYYLVSHGKNRKESLEGQADCRPLYRTEEILDICRFIHRMPVEEGYVRKLDDYWWSSFLTYRGIYSWEFVDTRPILWCFSDNREKNGRQFIKFHRQE